MKGKKGFISALIAAIIIAVAVYGALLLIEAEMHSAYETVDVLMVKTTLPAGEKIVTPENYFDRISVNAALINGTVLTADRLAQLQGCYATRSLTAGEIVYIDCFTDDTAKWARFSRPVKLSVAIQDNVQGVAGSLRKGDRVSIYVYVKEDATSTGRRTIAAVDEDEAPDDGALDDEAQTDEVLTDGVLTDGVLTDGVLAEEVLTDETSTEEAQTGGDLSGLLLLADSVELIEVYDSAGVRIEMGDKTAAAEMFVFYAEQEDAQNILNIIYDREIYLVKELY